MKQLPIKIVLHTVLIGTLSVASLTPSYAFAAKTPLSTLENEQKITSADKYLGPVGLQEALQETGSHTVVLDAYALTLLKSPSIKIDKDLFSEQREKDLVDSILKSQITAKEHATYWLNILKPKLTDVNQGIVNYGAKFDNYYDAIVAAINAKDKKATQQGITRLYKVIQDNKKTVAQLVTDLQTFRSSLVIDSTAFQSETNTMLASLEGKNAILPSLKQQIGAYNSEVHTALGMIATGSVLNILSGVLIVLTVATGVTGLGLPVATISGAAIAAGLSGGIAFIVQGRKQLNTANEQITLLTTKMKNTELQAAALQSASDQTISFTGTINAAINSAQSLSDQWSTMSSKYQSLLHNIDEISPEELGFIKEDLKTAKDSWLDIKKYATELSTNIIIQK